MLRVLSIAVAVAVPCVAIAELGGHVAVARGVPTEAEWDRLGDAVSGTRDPSDLLVVAPRWAEPHARQRVDMPIAQLARADVSRFAHATEIGLHGARSEELAAFTERSAVAVGPFVVRTLDNPAPDLVVFDFLEAFGPSTRVSGTVPAVRCTWSDREPVLAGGLGGHPTFPSSRSDCLGGPFMTAALTVIADERFLPRRCIWAHPFERGDKVLAFDQVPVGRARRLVGHHGMYWMIERDSKGADIEIEARVDGVTIGKAVHHDGDGWTAFTFDLPASGPDARATVELAVRTSDYQHRHYCFEATLR